MTATWKDATSYSRGERGTVDPRIWELDLAGLRVSVHRLRGVDGQWFGTCHAMGVEGRELSYDLEASKAVFLRYLKQRAWNWADKIAAAEVSK